MPLAMTMRIVKLYRKAKRGASELTPRSYSLAELVRPGLRAYAAEHQEPGADCHIQNACSGERHPVQDGDPHAPRTRRPVDPMAGFRLDGLVMSCHDEALLSLGTEPTRAYLQLTLVRLPAQDTYPYGTVLPDRPPSSRNQVDHFVSPELGRPNARDRPLRARREPGIETHCLNVCRQRDTHAKQCSVRFGRSGQRAVEVFDRVHGFLHFTFLSKHPKSLPVKLSYCVV